MDSIRELVDRVINETCFEQSCNHWGKYSCESVGCSNHFCIEHGERCQECGARFCLGCYGDHKHCTACGAKGKLFHGLCGICEAVWNHEQQEIHRLTSGWEDSE